MAALTVVLVAAAVFAGYHLFSGRSVPVPVPAPEVVSAGQAPPLPTASSPGAAPRIVVDVSGKVRDPGLHRLPAGARVGDAIDAAGGVTPGADITQLNRARLLGDGEQVLVGVDGLASGGQGGTAVAGASPAGPLGLNTATVEQLDALPGVGPVLARNIVEFRTERGGFRSVEELRQVAGIGERRFAELRALVRP
ncbi:helix-hairpin-helix domain-containing protein [Streptomyces sp. NPDC006879]|uniref:helix-hairpin-helix domain-containing protein n=1 Tax=Streptomyces sp. NPDC006879 TaxID=3364767 RepID=UPI00368BD0AF